MNERRVPAFIQGGSHGSISYCARGDRRVWRCFFSVRNRATQENLRLRSPFRGPLLKYRASVTRSSGNLICRSAVRIGSSADIRTSHSRIRFAIESRHQRRRTAMSAKGRNRTHALQQKLQPPEEDTKIKNAASLRKLNARSAPRGRAVERERGLRPSMAFVEVGNRGLRRH